jgi:hypothetical protein
VKFEIPSTKSNRAIGVVDATGHPWTDFVVATSSDIAMCPPKAIAISKKTDEVCLEPQAAIC